MEEVIVMVWYKVRLAGLSSQCAGRVEVYHRDTWGTVCDKSWDLVDAKVVCRQLGCGTAVRAAVSAEFGEGSGPVWLDDVNCHNYDFTLWDCPSADWGESKCLHRRDAGVVCSGNFKDLRLVSEEYDCAGKLEVFYNGTWGDVCTNGIDSTTVSVICNQLGCGDSGFLKEGKYDGKGRRVKWLDGVTCHGYESVLWECPSSPWGENNCQDGEEAVIKCSGEHALKSDYLRLLFNKSTHCAGRVQIFYDGQWGHVCSYSWDLPDAEVVCRQLGCGTAVSAPHHIHPENLPDDRLLTGVKCHGNETELGECDSRTWDQMLCQHVWDAGVICAGKAMSHDVPLTPIHLVNLVHTCTGRVEIYYRRRWGTVCSTGLGMSEAHLICKQMNCGEAETLTRFHVPPIDLPIWKDRIRCSGNETFLWECPSDPWGQHDCDHMMDTKIVCKGSLNISLENGGSPCAGQMFVKTSMSQGTVSDKVMEMPMANVVCTHIGCGSVVSIKTEGYFGLKNVNSWVIPIHCNGNESFLWQCYSAIIPQSISLEDPQYQSAGMVCSSHIKPRLFNDEDPCSGRVEVQFGETWGTFCDSNWDMEDASVVCHQLQCGTAVATLTGVYGEGSGPVWDRQFECRGNESILYDCPQSPPKAVNCTHRRDAGVICSGKGGPRLVGGASRCSGRVEILHDNTWGTLCDKNLDLQAADVICRHLYCGAAVSTPSGAYFGKGKGPIWRDNFQCNGNESRLGECAVSWDKASCDHSNDASIICSENGTTLYADLQVQLKGGESRCEGTVQVMLNGTWRQILYPEWDVQDASVVCAQLNCGEALKVQNISGYISGSGPVILTDINCAGDELSLQNCSVSVISELFNISGGVGVLCSGTELRLAGHSSQCAGRVEVYYNATWGTVSSNSWDLTDAQVVCRQLGCGNAVRTAVSAEFGKSSGPVWIDEVECRGDELALWKCPSLVWQENNYQHKEDAGVVCSGNNSIINHQVVHVILNVH
uniref:Soluble scavenger receptor cysteine-rich domain-containing protein SSC5D n=1 Tax=Erpetoichthys calabaricus TaxID=27687 RepID=A0A8C4SKV3_ERPCA